MLFPIVQDFFFLLVWQLCRWASFPSHPTHQIFSCKPWSPSDVSCSTYFSTFKSLSFAIGSLLASKPAFCIICWTFPVCPSYVYFKFPMTGTQESNFASVPCVFGAIFQDACPYISWLKLHCCFNNILFLGGSVIKKERKRKKIPSASAGDAGSIPVLGRFPREGDGNPLQYSCPQIHQKIIWTLRKYHKTTSERWWRTPGTQKGRPLSSKGGRTKYKR